MESVFEIPNGDEPPVRWRLTARNIMEFCTTESQTALGNVFAAWLSSRPEGKHRRFDPFRGDVLGVNFTGETIGLDFRDFSGPPADSAFEPDCESTFCADVRSPDPAGFVIHSRTIPSMRLSDVDDPVLNRTLMSDLLVCRGSRHPFYHQIEQNSAGQAVHYMRLLLPVGNVRREVVKIYAFCRSLARNDITLEQLVATPA